MPNCLRTLAVAALAALLLLRPYGAEAKNEEPTVAAYFAPGGNIEPAIVSVINDAKHEIVVAMYLFTSRPLSEALVKAKKRGVDVRIVLDSDQKSVRHGKYADLKKGGIPIRLMELGKTSENQPIKFHNKFLVADGQTVETGSFNWTQQADGENWENAVIVRSRALAADFKEQFEKAWAAAESEDGPQKSLSSGE